MNKKKIYGSLLLFAVVILFTSFCHATDNTMLGNVINNVQNAVSGTENTIEGMAQNTSDTSKTITKNMENTANSFVNNITDNKNESMNTEQNNNQFMGVTNTDKNTVEYSATRTATTDTNFLGMNSTTWIWVILAILGITIIALIYYFSMQNNQYNYENDDK